MYLLSFIMNNQYYLRYCKLLPGIVRHKHDRNVKQQEIYYYHVVVRAIWLYRGGKVTK